MHLFTDIERNILLECVTKIAQSDNRVSGGALVGSFASNEIDRYSDIDITFGIKPEFEPLSVLNEWTISLKSEIEIVDYFDVKRDSAIYRVILFSNGLEIDLSVVPKIDYGPISPNFKLLFGEAINRTNFLEQPLRTLIGWGWHHVLHANSAIKRLNLWQAEYWLSSLRNYIISMKCMRLGLPSAHARGADRINNFDKKVLESTLIQTLELKELYKVLMILANEYIKEVLPENINLAAVLQNIFQKALGDDFEFTIKK
jgi:hypothetical protein